MANQILPDDYKLSLLERLADRFALEPNTIAYRMAQAGITGEDLGLDRAQAVHLRLCLVPRPGALEEDIATIANAAGITPDVVRKAVGG